MRRNATFIAAIVLLLAGVGAFALLRPGASSETNITGPNSAPDVERVPSGSASSDLKPTRTVDRKPKVDETADLVDQYGESRTNLSRQIVNNVTSLLDDVLEMGDMMTSGQGGQFGNRGDWVMREALKDTGVELDDAQKESAAEIYREYQKRELEKARSNVESLKKNPSVLMGFMLASDAKSRGEIGDDEFAVLQEATAKEMKDIVNPLDQNNFRGGQPMQDEQFRSEFEAILSEEQASSFTTATADREPTRKLTNITEMPVMDLESIDRSISSAKQMTSGFKNIMQGMGNLQELEKERKADE